MAEIQKNNTEEICQGKGGTKINTFFTSDL